MAAFDPTCVKLNCPEKIIALMRDFYPTLTDREGICLFWSCLFLTKQEISQRLGVSENTVKTHLKSVLVKLEANSIRDIKTSFLAGLILFNIFY